jgi:hypothetical protein
VDEQKKVRDQNKVTKGGFGRWSVGKVSSDRGGRGEEEARKREEGWAYVVSER